MTSGYRRLPVAEIWRVTFRVPPETPGRLNSIDSMAGIPHRQCHPKYLPTGINARLRSTCCCRRRRFRRRRWWSTSPGRSSRQRGWKSKRDRRSV